MKKLIFAVAAMFATVAGCRAQVPPATSYAVNLTWTAPVAGGSWGGCTAAAPCTYAVYRAAAVAGSCPAFANVAWQEITTASTRPGATAYQDPNAAGINACYAVETVQGSANSGPSNIFQIAVPSAPGQPSGVTGAQQAAALAPSIEKPIELPVATKELALASPGNLHVE